MRIAIVGAGIAGLTCAYLLKDRFDVEIFEASRDPEGCRNLQMLCTINMLKNVPDRGIIKPSYPLDGMNIYSAYNSCRLYGDLGYAYRMGGSSGVDYEMRSRLEREVDIHYGSEIRSLDELSDYDRIIGADGHRAKVAKMAGFCEGEPYLTGYGVGSRIDGDFELKRIEAAFDSFPSQHGYTYLLPIDKKSASLVSISITKKMDTKKSRDLLREHAKMSGYRIVDEWTEFRSWHRYERYSDGRVYIVGDAMGASESFMGFGLRDSIDSAKLCARAILEDKSYDILLHDLLKRNRFVDEISFLTKSDDTELLDVMVAMMKLPGITGYLSMGFPLDPIIMGLKFLKTFMPKERILKLSKDIFKKTGLIDNCRD